MGDLHGPLMCPPAVSTPPQDLLLPLTASLAAEAAVPWLAAAAAPEGAENCRMKPVTLFLIDGIAENRTTGCSVNAISGGITQRSLELTHSEHVLHYNSLFGMPRFDVDDLLLLLSMQSGPAAYSRLPSSSSSSPTCDTTTESHSLTHSLGSGRRLSLLPPLPSSELATAECRQTVSLCSQLIDFMSRPTPPICLLPPPSFTLRCGPSSERSP